MIHNDTYIYYIIYMYHVNHVTICYTLLYLIMIENNNGITIKIQN
jgi:hypothetical protein